MIKFFRNIRRQLLTENKFTKYFIYAIGEIVLVVIGILIAIQLNNWNESKKMDSKAQNLNFRLSKEVSKNIEESLIQLKISKDRVNGLTTLMQLIGNPSENHNQKNINSLIIYSLDDFILALDLNTLTEAKENGEISLFKNDSLRTSFYNLLAIKGFIAERISVANYDNNNYYQPYLYKKANLRNIYAVMSEQYYRKVSYSNSNLEESNYNQILMDREFENLLTVRLSYAKENLNHYQNLNENLKLIKELLDKEK